MIIKTARLFIDGVNITDRPSRTHTTTELAQHLDLIDLTDEIEAGPNAYTEFCDSSTDLADAALAWALLADGERRTLKFSGTCSAVLTDQ